MVRACSLIQSACESCREQLVSCSALTKGIDKEIKIMYESGIDYGNGQTNVDHQTGIRYGVINQHEVLQAWADSSKPYYGKPYSFICSNCEQEVSINTNGDPVLNYGDEVDCPECGKSTELMLDDFQEPISFFVNDGEYSAECGEDGDIFITKSPYYTLCSFCSPCAPGAGYLTQEGSIKAYCFGHDWFEDGKAPYKVYRVSDGKEVFPV